MKDISVVYQSMEEDINSVQAWADEMYESNFARHFSYQRHIYHRIQDKSKPITDLELEAVLTEVPLELFTVSEVLSQFRLRLEVVKLKNKEHERDLHDEFAALFPDGKSSQEKEWIECRINEHKLVVIVYNTIISRVESEISFSRELIMSCKKIWDARRRTDAVHPVSPGPELPEYTGPSSY